MKKVKIRLPKVKLIYAIFFMLIVNIIFLYNFLNTDLLPHTTNNSDLPEVKELSNLNLNFTELKNYFTELAEKKGGEYAYKVLAVAPMPPNTDMHLMGHVVGEVLYKQKGAEGMQVCTNDFRNACSHTIVVGLLLDKGEIALKEIQDSCSKAPGGKGAYTMCYHGLGHGVLAYTEYDLPKTVELCNKVVATKTQGQESSECVGGAIMEIISGGDHDKQVWEKQRIKYFKEDDPLYPCTSNFISDIGAKNMCFTYLSPHLLTTAGGNLANPSPESFKRAFQFCDVLAEEPLRRSCFGGVGKEYVSLVKQRDIRNVDSMTQQELEKISDNCKLASKEDAVDYCIQAAMGSMYWGGENTYDSSINLCKTIPSSAQSRCFEYLQGMVFYYSPNSNYKKTFCSKMPGPYNSSCLSAI